MRIRCVIVDDEPLALDALSALIGKIPELEIIARCQDAVDALQVLHRENIDLIFLDIQMPELTGLEMLRSLSNPPRVIFTTAYREYAAEAFDLDVVDYLLKPISLERLLRAVNRYFDRIKRKDKTTSAGESEIQETIVIYSDKKNHRVNIAEILYVEGLKDYAIIHTDSIRLITRETMKKLEESLSPFNFLRVHRSWIVSCGRVSSWTGHSLNIGKTEIPIGKTYRKTVLEYLESQS
jgi:DNA-binding LytR/AlgR family response regulator